MWWFWPSDSAGDVGFATQTETQLTMTLEERFPEDWKPDASTAQMSVGSWVEGRWWTEQHLVRELWNEIVAYDVADGSVAWRVPVEGNGACRASRDVSPEGYVAVLRGKPFDEKGPKPCDQLTVVDINTGKEVWTSAIQPGVASVLPDVGDHPVIWGETVHVTGQGQRKFDLETGAQKELKNRDCWISDLAVFGDTLVTWQCRALVAFGRDGNQLWAWPFPGDDKVEKRRAGVAGAARWWSGRAHRAHGAGHGQCADAVVGDGMLHLKYAMDANHCSRSASTRTDG